MRPATAKLSRRSHDQFGDEIASELVAGGDTGA